MERNLFIRLIWGKVFKNGTSEISGRQLLKNFTWSILEYFVPYVRIKRDTNIFFSYLKILIKNQF